MKADSFSPFDIFQKPQRLRVPQYQRPYVWSRDLQWEPLWEDITGLALRYLEGGKKDVLPHFLGAVVLQHQFNDPNALQERSIVDGQQRLTTLQILIDAVQAQLVASGALKDALWLQELVENDERYRSEPDDMFKLLPTNRDLPGYREVMASSPPIDYSKLTFKNDRVVEAHRYFAQATSDFLAEESEFSPEDRAAALRVAIRDFLRVVVISLEPSEDAQAIFETLNSRGTPLSSADLIKNLLFQRLEAENVDVAEVDEKYWRIFEKSFWEREVSVGRRSYSQSSIFLTHFLVSRTGEVVVASEVFNRFKQFVQTEWAKSTLELVKEIFALAEFYERSAERASLETGELNLAELFLYRMQTMDTDSVRPLFLHLLDPALDALPEEDLVQILGDVESWLVRRALLRLSAKRYNRIFAELIRDLLASPRSNAANVVRSTLTSFNAETNLWPDDQMLRNELPKAPLYRNIRRDRMRMILEAVEDDLRGYTLTAEPKTEERCPRHILTIEHVLPQNWTDNWPLNDGEDAETRRGLVHTLGNLTLIRGRLNSSISNSGWETPGGKRDELRKHARLALSGGLESFDSGNWTHEAIESRTAELLERIVNIWPAPRGHTVKPVIVPILEPTYVSMLDLISAGFVDVGTQLEPRSSTYRGRYCTVLSNGHLECDDGKVFETPSGAGKHVTGRPSVNGWWFWKFKGRDGLPARLREEYLLRFHLDGTIDDVDGSEFDDNDFEAESESSPE
jgi:Protein of unknown function DUF262/Protein of unknown function (DUF1524)/Restriction Enzyme Adenine Methylase Associated